MCVVMTQVLLDKSKFIILLSSAVLKAGSQYRLAKELGITPQFLGQLLMGKKNPGSKILGKMGLKQVRMYEVLKANLSKERGNGNGK